MADAIYRRFVHEMMQSGLSESLDGSSNFKAYAIDTADYTPDFGAGGDKLKADVPTAALVAGPVTMTTVSLDGSNDAQVSWDDFTFSSVSGDTVEALLYTLADAAFSEAIGDEVLVAYDDSASFTPDGNDVNVSYSSYVFEVGGQI